MAPSKQYKAIVLVVEDEPIIRMLALDIVEEAGFDTVEASDAGEALVILEGRNDVRLVFTDVNMPGSVDGLDLAAAVRERWPDVEVIVTSGRPLPDGLTLPERVEFIPKPYNLKNLTEALQRMSDR